MLLNQYERKGTNYFSNCNTFGEKNDKSKGITDKLRTNMSIIVRKKA